MNSSLVRILALSATLTLSFPIVCRAEMQINFNAINSFFPTVDSIAICMASMNLSSVQAERSKNKAQISYAKLMVEKSAYVATVLIRTRGFSLERIKNRLNYFFSYAERDSLESYEGCRGRLNASVTEITLINPNGDPRDIFNKRYR